MPYTSDYIYAIRNKVTGRIYIGRTGRLKDRYIQHMRALYYNNHTNELMQQDFNEYGVDSFTFSVIDEVRTYDEMHKEHDWMYRLKSYLPEFGYNTKEKLCKKKAEELAWPEPEWVRELKSRIGTQPQKRHRKH